MSEFVEWDSFYVIVGSAAGALIGLQFVVLTLIAERPPLRAADAGAAFATPTIVHFGTALLLSAILRAPWQAVTPVAALWGVVGIRGSLSHPRGLVRRRNCGTAAALHRHSQRLGRRRLPRIRPKAGCRGLSSLATRSRLLQHASEREGEASG